MSSSLHGDSYETGMSYCCKKVRKQVEAKNSRMASELVYEEFKMHAIKKMNEVVKKHCTPETTFTPMVQSRSKTERW
ncbi:hypothetical protein ElyMa_001992700 [Elysia marginata]|uniref:Uncharacterized protein n=1 Tax=Elysia marginata TaxID=1093978 RepID=A0AAV4F1Y4_9GAST|nr:hypothetical protein ElyMa_001992700 [Elysia marginata]